jgi:hypothetical protein
MITPKNQLIANINSQIVDNKEGKITPFNVRQNLIDIIDSVSLLLEGKSINTTNFATPAVRSTKVGEQTFEKINLDNAFSVDNVAVGYSALKSTFQSNQNTAIGSQSLNCNIYGSSNSAFGFNALGGNTTGIGNVGLGNNTLINNKIGNFNIAIGHSAGYYSTRNTSYKLFIASHPVDSNYICDNPLGSGLTPLVFGDLSPNNLRFGIAVNNLHTASTLQVSGGIAPSVSSIDNLGHPSYRFKDMYLSDKLAFPNNKSLQYVSNQFYVNASLIPSGNRECDFGASGYQWKSGHFFDIYVSGTAYIENYVRKQIFDCSYECKTLYLASSENCYSENCGYLNDQQLQGAGFVVQSSGYDYLRNYNFTFKPSGSIVSSSVESGSIYEKSYWHSNISLALDDDVHLRTKRVLSGGQLSLTTDPDSYGLFLNNDKMYLSRETVIPPDWDQEQGLIAGLGDINFINSSGKCGEYSVVYSSLESGVSISQKFINGNIERTTDPLNENKDNLRGFELKYIDDTYETYEGNLSDRFVLRSFNNTSDGVNNVILMKDDPNGGVLGVNNFDTGGDALFPNTLLNIRSKDNAVVRVTAENMGGSVYSAVQLLGGENCLKDGFETIYYHNSGIVDLNMYQDSGRLTVYRFEPYQAGLFSSGELNSTLTIGYSGFPHSSISLRDNSFVSGPSIVASSGYGKIYNQKVNREHANQSHALFLMDASGWTHDLTTNNLDVIDARAVYSTDFNIGAAFGGNTFAGNNAPRTRKDFINQRTGNTAYGTRALYSLASGDYNTAIGLYAGSGIVNGYDNIVVGALSALHVESGYRNIVLGNNSFVNTSGVVNNNIVIGNSIANSHKDNYNLLIGNNSILVSGKLGPGINDRSLALPNSGLFEIYNTNNANKTQLRHSSVDVYNDLGEYPVDQLRFNFATQSGVNNLLILDHSVKPSGSANYSCDNLPYAELNGNLRLLNSLCFSDSTSVNSAKFLDTIDNLEVSGIDIHSRFNSLIIEGFATQNIKNPSSSNVPSSGTIQTRLSNWAIGPNVTIINRDRFLKIDQNDYVIAIKINNEYRPLWVSSEALLCNSCNI